MPRTRLKPAKPAAVEQLEKKLRERIVGQDDAIQTISSAYQTYLGGMSNPGQPVASFLFLGPTGTGKTRTVEALSEALYGTPKAVIKIDCAEFQHSHEIAKLIGSPPGYLGHRETHALLSQEALNQFHTDTTKLSLVLFDEIEKASDALWNLLLGVLDKATLTLGDNRRVNFQNALIFMTSNLGAAEMEAAKQPFGLCATPEELDNKKLASLGEHAARKKFTPEFRNRISYKVAFRSLGKEELQSILDLELAAVEWRYIKVGGCSLHFTQSAKNFLLREGTDVRYGARPLKRVLEGCLISPLAGFLAGGSIQPGSSLEVDLEDGEIVFNVESEENQVSSVTSKPDTSTPSKITAMSGEKVSGTDPKWPDRYDRNVSRWVRSIEEAKRQRHKGKL